jgi:crossover junction endodeoxyribonuclease RuvC
MIIAGFDPGTQRCGYALAEVCGTRLQILDLGCWELLENTQKRDDVGLRLERLHEHSSQWLRKFNPHYIGIEKAVSFKSVPSAFTLSEARGVLRLAIFQNLAEAPGRIFELSPTKVKKDSGTSGLATKEQVMKALCVRFVGLEDLVLHKAFPPDAFDALAVAFSTWIQLRTQMLGIHSRKVREV